MGILFPRVSRFVNVDRVGQAIRAAETRTSGEIRVSVAPPFWGNVERAAKRAFDRLGMSRTRARNGVLLFLVPSRRTFVVLGDTGIHDRVGQQFWHELVTLMNPHFRRGAFTDGVVAGIGAIAEQLARHFPHDAPTDVNELPDEIDAPRRP